MSYQRRRRWTLGIPYQNQHQEVERLVGRRVTVAPDDRPRTLAVARRYADSAVAAATTRGVRVGVAVVDELGHSGWARVQSVTAAATAVTA